MPVMSVSECLTDMLKCLVCGVEGLFEGWIQSCSLLEKETEEISLVGRYYNDAFVGGRWQADDGGWKLF